MRKLRTQEIYPRFWSGTATEFTVDFPPVQVWYSHQGCGLEVQIYSEILVHLVKIEQFLSEVVADMEGLKSCGSLVPSALVNPNFFNPTKFFTLVYFNPTSCGKCPVNPGPSRILVHKVRT